MPAAKLRPAFCPVSGCKTYLPDVNKRPSHSGRPLLFSQQLTPCRTGGTIFNMKRIAVAIAVMLLATGCMNNGIEWSELAFTRHRPADQDIVGTWVPTEKSIKLLARMRGASPMPSPQFDLRPDGTVSVRDFPDWFWSEDARVTFRFKSGEGRWRVSPEKVVYTIYVLEIELGDDVHTINISKQKAPYQLHVTIGDPDSGDYLIFERAP